MTKDEARRILDLVCGGFLDITFSGHFQQRLRERIPGFGPQEVMTVLRDGTFRGDPVRDPVHGNDKVRIGKTMPGRGRIEIIVAIARYENAIAITIYSIDRK